MWNRQLPTVHRSATRHSRPQEQRDLPSGAIVDGRYRIRSLLARGGMGAVYLANQESLARDVALKVLTLFPQQHGQQQQDLFPSISSSHITASQAEPIAFQVQPLSNSDYYADLRYRMRLEAAAASKLQHHNIVTVYDQGLIAGLYPYLAMEYLSGRSLATALKQQGQMSLARALHLAWQIACGLAHAHQRDLVHRDIKPSNIMLVVEQGIEWCKILDFGLALQSNPPTQQQAAAHWLGTPGYMAPEQIQGHSVDQRADIYNWGLVLFEMLAGQPPFPLSDQRACLAAHVAQAPPPIALFEPLIPISLMVDVQQLLDGCLAKQPEKRFATLEEALLQLASIWQRLPQLEPIANTISPFGYQHAPVEPTQIHPKWQVTPQARQHAQRYLAGLFPTSAAKSAPEKAAPPRWRAYWQRYSPFLLPVLAMLMLFVVGLTVSQPSQGYCLLTLDSTPSGARVYAHEQLVCEQTPCLVQWYTAPKLGNQPVVLRFEHTGYWPTMVPLIPQGHHHTAWAPLQAILAEDRAS